MYGLNQVVTKKEKEKEKRDSVYRLASTFSFTDLFWLESFLVGYIRIL